MAFELVVRPEAKPNGDESDQTTDNEHAVRRAKPPATMVRPLTRDRDVCSCNEQRTDRPARDCDPFPPVSPDAYHGAILTTFRAVCPGTPNVI